MKQPDKTGVPALWKGKQLFASKYKLYLPTEKELIEELNSEMQILKNKKLK